MSQLTISLSVGELGCRRVSRRYLPLKNCTIAPANPFGPDENFSGPGRNGRGPDGNRLSETGFLQTIPGVWHL